MYKFKSNIIYYKSAKQNILYILNCSNNEIAEIDSVGAELINELFETNNEKRAEEILSLFEGCDFFEKRSA